MGNAEDRIKAEKKSQLTQWGDSLLLTPTNPVPEDYIKTPEFQNICDKMFEDMTASGGWGLAANQAGMPMRFATIEIKPIENHPELSVVPKIVIINPEILEKSGENVYSWEACLSCPNTTVFYVPRAKWINVKYLDRNGKSFTEKIEGLASIVYQHEIDHLDGQTCGERVLIIDGKVAKGAIMAFDEYRKHPREIPESAKHLVKEAKFD